MSIICVLALLLTGPIYLLMSGGVTTMHWSSASSESAGIAPHPSVEKEAVIQVYAARTWGWRGAVAVHTWISVKPSDADSYTVYQKIGWGLRYGKTAVYSRQDIPDRYWYGNPPILLVDLRGEGVDDVIDQLHTAAMEYPHAQQYRVWPGPNSNTFVAWIARRVPALQLDLPATAIGKDWLGANQFLASAPSGTGVQVSVLGVLGVTLGIEEGIEFNLGGFHFGVDPLDLALRLPGFGRVDLLPEKVHARHEF